MTHTYNIFCYTFHKETAYVPIFCHMYICQYIHCNQGTFLYIPLRSRYSEHIFPDIGWSTGHIHLHKNLANLHKDLTEKEKNSGWGRDWAPVAVPIYKRYKQTNNRM